MEFITETMQEFIITVALPRGMTIDDVERNCKDAMRCGHDWKISVGLQSDLHTITLDSIKAYFAAKAAPKPAPQPSPVEAFMLEDIPPAKSEKEKVKGVTQK